MVASKARREIVMLSSRSSVLCSSVDPLEWFCRFPMCGFVKLARPRRFERPTFAFGGQRSIQLSYGRLRAGIDETSASGNGPDFAQLDEGGGSCGDGRSFESSRARQGTRVP